MQPEASLISEPVLDAAGFQALTGVSDSQLPTCGASRRCWPSGTR
jgi:hypothetical protein